MVHERRSARSRFTWGILLLVCGALALAVNLGISIPREFWDYWPAILVALGLVQLIWPGSGRERLSGLWLIAVGCYGFISVFEIFGLNWGTSWPILIVALGVRIVFTSFFGNRRGSSSTNSPNTTGQSGQGGLK